MPSCISILIDWYYAYISVDTESIVLIQCPRVAEVFLWLVLCLYFRVYTRLDSLDTVPSCSLSILMVGIMLIFPWIYETR